MTQLATAEVALEATGVKEFDRTFTSVGDRVKAAGEKMTAVGSKLTVGLTVPITALGTASLLAANRAEDAGDKFDTVFGGAADAVRQRLEELFDIIPLTTGELENMAAGFQDMLVPMGLVNEDAAVLSVKFLEAAADLASFQGAGTTTAMTIADINSALAGSAETLFKYGINTKVARLETIALEKGLITQGQEMNDAARATAIYEAIIRDSAAAMGDLERTSDSNSNSLERMWRNIRQVGEEIGKVIQPYVLPLAERVSDLATRFREADPTIQRVTVAVAALAAAIGPVLVVLGTLTAAVAAVSAPVAIMVTAMGAAVAATLAFREEITIAWRVVVKVTEAAVKAIDKIMGRTLRKVWEMAVDGVTWLWERIREVLGRIVDVFAWFADKIGLDIIPDMVAEVRAEMTEMGDGMETTAADTSTEVVQTFEDLAAGVVGNTEAMRQKALAEFVKMAQDIKPRIRQLKGDVIGEFVGLREELPLPEIKADVVDTFTEIKISVSETAKEVTGAIKDAFDTLGIELPGPVNTIVNEMDRVVKIFENMDKLDIPNIVGKIVGFFDSLVSSLPTIADTITGLITKIGGIFAFQQGDTRLAFGSAGGAPPGYVPVVGGDVSVLLFDSFERHRTFMMAAMDRANETLLVIAGNTSGLVTGATAGQIAAYGGGVPSGLSSSARIAVQRDMGREVVLQNEISGLNSLG